MTDHIKSRKSAVTPKGFNHLVLNVRNMEESHHFWCDMLGFKQVGQLKPRPPGSGRPDMTMRFYSGVTNDVNHHDIALVEVPSMPENPEWSLAGTACAINHVAITYPDRESWLEQVKFLEEQGALQNPLRVDHGMTHSVYITDPNGYGVEVLYELPEKIWRHDIDGALNYANVLPNDDLYTDTTDYETKFS
jgi:catechol 2,3-dioxygenase-like lactoylglutathione lyase family enzyme